jgi:hypothetical protein
MLNKEQAQKVAPLIHNSQAWEGLVQYLADLHQLTLRGLVTATSEQEMFRLQGKMALLETLLNLPDSHRAVVDQYNNK